MLLKMSRKKARNKLVLLFFVLVGEHQHLGHKTLFTLFISTIRSFLKTFFTTKNKIMTTGCYILDSKMCAVSNFQVFFVYRNAVIEGSFILVLFRDLLPFVVNLHQQEIIASISLYQEFL